MEWLPIIAGALALLAPMGAGMVNLIKHLAGIWLRAKSLEHTGKDIESDEEGEPPHESTDGRTKRKTGRGGSRGHTG